MKPRKGVKRQESVRSGDARRNAASGGSSDDQAIDVLLELLAYEKHIASARMVSLQDKANSDAPVLPWEERDKHIVMYRHLVDLFDSFAEAEQVPRLLWLIYQIGFSVGSIRQFEDHFEAREAWWRRYRQSRAGGHGGLRRPSEGWWKEAIEKLRADQPRHMATHPDYNARAFARAVHREWAAALRAQKVPAKEMPSEETVFRWMVDRLLVAPGPQRRKRRRRKS